MRYFDVDQPFAERPASAHLSDIDRALADDLEDGVESPSSDTTVRQFEAPAVQPPARNMEVASVSVSIESSIERRYEASSADSSSLSSDTLITDYGLHRALNSLTISQSFIHKASKKAQKNLRYLEDMRATHDQVRSELDSAIIEYHEAFNLRDANDDPKLEGTLNCQFLAASNRLSRASREYRTYVDDLNELRHMPKLSRAALQTAFTDRKIAAKLDRQDDEDVSMREKLRQNREQIQELERMRKDLMVGTNPIPNMSEYVDSLEKDCDRLRKQRNDLASERNALVVQRTDLQIERDGLAVDLKALTTQRDSLSAKHDSVTAERTTLAAAQTVLATDRNALIVEKHDLTAERDRIAAERNSIAAERDSIAAERDNLAAERNSLATDVSFKTEYALDLDAALKSAHAKLAAQVLELTTYQSQLSFAKAETTRHKDEGKSLRREVQDLNYNLAGAQDEIETLRDENANLKRSLAHLRGEFDEVHEQASTLQRRYSDVTSSGRRSAVMEPSPSPFYGGGLTSASIQEMMEEREMMGGD